MIRRTLSVVLTAAVLAPPFAHAQTSGPAPPDRGEGVAVGVVATVAPGQTGPWWLLSLRVGVPVGRKVGVDLDFGRVVGNGQWGTGWKPKGFAGGAHLRWLPKGRSAGGWSGYLFLGPRFVQTEKTAAGGETTRSVARGFDFPGFGVDRVLRNGYRAGFELGIPNVVHEVPIGFLNIFALGMPQ